MRGLVIYVQDHSPYRVDDLMNNLKRDSLQVVVLLPSSFQGWIVLAMGMSPLAMRHHAATALSCGMRCQPIDLTAEE